MFNLQRSEQLFSVELAVLVHFNSRMNLICALLQLKVRVELIWSTVVVLVGDFVVVHLKRTFLVSEDVHIKRGWLRMELRVKFDF